MLLAADTLIAPTLVGGIAAAVAAGVLLSLQPRGAPMYRQRFQRLLALGRSPGQLTFLSLATLASATVAVAYLAFIGRQPIVAVVLAGIAFWGFGWLLASLIERDERRLRNQLADFSIAMAGALRAGLSPSEAIGRTAAESPRPLAPLLTRVFEDYQRGATILDALHAARCRLSLDAFNLFAAAVGMTLQRGGRLDEALERISDSIHDQQRLEDKLLALTASGRSAMIVLGVFPFAFAAFFYTLDPTGYQVLLESLPGRASVGAAIAAVFLAVRWAKSILDAVG